MKQDSSGGTTSDTTSSNFAKLLAVDLRSLAMFRIAIALVLLYDLAARAGDIQAMYTDSGAAPLAAVREHLRDTWCWSLHWIHGSFAWQASLFGIAFLAGAALLIGCRTRAASFVAWMLTASLHYRAPHLATGGDVLLVLMLFWGIFLPLGARWSWDHRRAFKRNPSGEFSAQDAPYVLTVASAGAMLQLAMMYFFTGLWKLQPDWLQGVALERTMNDETLVRSLGRWLSGFPFLLRWLTWGTLALELTGPLLLFVPWRRAWFRGAALAAFAVLHVGIQCTINVLIFSFASLAALWLFVPGVWWNQTPLKHLASMLDWFFAVRRIPKKTTPHRQSVVPNRLQRCGKMAGVACIAYMFTYNLVLVSYGGVWPAQWSALRAPADVFAWGQLWNMFHDTRELNYRAVVLGRLANGSRMDLLRRRPVLDSAVRPREPATFSSDRWMLFYRHMNTPIFPSLRPHLLEYVASRWNADHAQADLTSPKRVIELELLYYPDPHYDRGANNDHGPRTVAYFDTRASGAYQAGRREGLWVNRHDNGKLASRGEYRHGEEEGLWTLWNEEGVKEAKGYFRKGKMHGRWTFYYPDGTNVTTQFDNNRQVDDVSSADESPGGSAEDR